MSKTSIGVLLFLIALGACKSVSTNPVEGQKLRLITSDQDTVSAVYSSVTFTVTVLDASGYGVSGAYIDFYDPIEKRARHEGPTPEDGQWMITDSISQSMDAGYFEFGFTAAHDGAATSDSVRIWLHKLDIRAWIIDTIAATSWDANNIAITWSRPAVDTATDTVIVLTSNQEVALETVPYPQNIAFIPLSGIGSASEPISIHNSYASSKSIIWAPADYDSDITVYETADSNYYDYSGIYFAYGSSESIKYSTYQTLVDIVVASDPTNSKSGLTIVSPSISSLSGFSNGKTTAFYDPVQFIDSGNNLHQLFYTNDLSTYVTGATPLHEIQLPDSSKYSTAFIAVTQDGHYARVSVGPVIRDWSDHKFVDVSLSYQRAAGVPYAKTHSKSPDKH